MLFLSTCGVTIVSQRAKADLVTRPRTQLLQLGDGGGMIRKQGEACGPLFGERDAAVVQPIVQPMRRHLEGACALGHRHIPRELARVGLMPLLQDAVPQAHTFDGAGQDGEARGRAIAALGAVLGHDVVHGSGGPSRQNLLGHSRGGGHVAEGAHGDGPLQGGRCAPLPHNAGVHLVPAHPVDDDLVDQTASQRCALWWREDIGVPERGELVANGRERGAQLCGERQRDGERLRVVGGALFGPLQCVAGSVPALLQCRRHEPIVRVHAQKLALAQRDLIAQALHLLGVSGSALVRLVLPQGHGLHRDVKLDGGQGGKKGVHHAGIDGIRWQMLAHRHVILLAEGGTEVACAALVLHDHRRPACAAGAEPLQQRLPGARDAAGFVPIIGGVVVGEPRVNLGEGFPGERGRIFVVDADAPLMQWQAWRRRPPLRAVAAVRSRPSIHTGPCLGRMLQESEHRVDGGRFPAQSTPAIATRSRHPLGLAYLEDFARGALLEARGNDQREAGLDLPLGIFLYGALGIPDEARRALEGQSTACGLVEEPSGHARADRVQCECRERPLQPK